MGISHTDTRVSASSAGQGQARITPDGFLTDLTPLFQSLTGLNPEGDTAVPWEKLLTSLSMPRRRALVQQWQTTGLIDVVLPLPAPRQHQRARLLIAPLPTGPNTYEGYQVQLTPVPPHTGDVGQNLAHAHDLLQLAITAAKDGVWDWDIQTGQTYFSPQWYQMLGYAPNELPNRYATWEDLLCPEDRTPVLEALQAHLDGTKPEYAVEMRLKTKDDDWKWVLARGVVTERQPDGTPRRMVGTHTDVDAHKRLETELLQSLNALTGANQVISAISTVQANFIAGRPAALLFEEMLAHMVALTQSRFGFIGEVLYPAPDEPVLKLHHVNPALRDVLAATPDAPLANPDTLAAGVMLPPGDALFASLLQTGQLVVGNQPACGLWPGGPVALDNYLGLPIYHGLVLKGIVGVANSPAGYSQVLIDSLYPLLVTYGQLISAYRTEQRRQQTEHSLQQTLAQLQQTEQLFSLSNEMLAIANVEGYFLKINPAFEKTLGMSTEALLRQPFLTWIHPDDVQPTLNEMAKLKEGQMTLYFENRYRCHDGQYRWLQWAAVPAVDQGLIYAVAHDVTERKKLEFNLTTTLKQLQETEQQRRTFIAALTHDLRTPLIAQRRVLEVLLEELDQHPDAEWRKMGQGLLANNDNLLQMVNRLLEIYQYEDGTVTLSLGPVDVAALVQSCLEEMAALLSSRQIKVISEIPADFPTVTADAIQLRRVFQNLLGNAFKHCPPAATVCITATESATDYRFSVADDGPGMNPAFAGAIFQRSLMGVTARQQIGSGLGLYISRLIVELHGGTIQHVGQHKPGTCIAFTLPKSLPAQPEA